MICGYPAIGGSKIQVFMDTLCIITFNIVRTPEYKSNIPQATLGCIVYYAPENDVVVAKYEQSCDSSFSLLEKLKKSKNSTVFVLRILYLSFK